MQYSDEQILKHSPFVPILVMATFAWRKCHLNEVMQLFQRFMWQPAENPSPLFRLQIERILANDNFVAGFLQRNPLEVLAVLKEIRNVLDNSHPKEAELFCSELIVFARFVAIQTGEEGGMALTEKQRNKESLLRAMLLKSEPKTREEMSAILGLVDG